MTTEYTKEDVAKHNTKGDAWITIQGDVYDISKFASMHPGGEKVILKMAGKDSTEIFYSYHRHEVLEKYAKLKIGVIKGNTEVVISDYSKISEVPYAEAPFWRNLPSPYYNESHIKFRLAVREFLHKEVRAEAEKFELSGKQPSDEVYHKMGDFGLLACRIPGGEHLKMVKELPGGVKPQDFTYFHEMIAHEEMARMGAPGYVDGLGAGYVIGLPPVLQFGPKWMKEKVGREVVLGRKRICLAITEPSGGSDVANLECTAVLSADKTHYIVNGEKKWITNGHAAHYFVTAVRTGGKGATGVSLLLIERSEGLETRPIKTAYSAAAGTAYVTFEDVKVPVANLIGRENAGFLCIMYNFNHERWMIVCYVIAGIRGCVEETFKWACQRKAFGKRLIDQPVVRQKLAHMVAETEAVHSWMEQVTYQMTQLSYSAQGSKLGGSTSLLKYQCTRVAHLVADESVQIFGGRGITQTGMGRMIEMFHRTYKFGSILGGSEEIMADLGIKIAMKQMPKNAKL